jgi:hypothetical protein
MHSFIGTGSYYENAASKIGLSDLHHFYLCMCTESWFQYENYKLNVLALNNISSDCLRRLSIPIRIEVLVAFPLKITIL